MIVLRHRLWRYTVVLLLVIAWLTGCVSSKPPSPAPNAVLALLRQYPQGQLTEDRILQDVGDTIYRISFAVLTTPEAAVAHYDAPLRALGLEENPSRGPTPTFDSLPVDYRWMYYGCPFHAVAITTTAQQLIITYTTGPCR